MSALIQFSSRKIKYSICTAVLLALLLPGIASAQRSKTKTFNMSRNGHLLVDIKYGDIIINTWDKNVVEVKYESDFDFDSDDFMIKSAGNHVRIRSYVSEYSDFWITVPRQIYIEMKTQGGDLRVNGSFSGSLEGSTSGGDIILENINGFINLVTYGGDIKANEIKGEMKISSRGGDLQLSNIEGNGSIQTSGGNIKIKNISKSVAVSTGGGNIYVEEIKGKTKLNTGGGNISIVNIEGSAVLNSGGGNINAKKVNGDVNASTTSGNIYLYKMNGTAQATSGSGDIVLELMNDKSDQTQLRTANGKIKLFLPANAKVTVDIRIRSVGSYKFDERDFIKCELIPSNKTVNRNSNNITATYSFNGGGKKIYLDTSYGEIEIKRLTN